MSDPATSCDAVCSCGCGRATCACCTHGDPTSDLSRLGRELAAAESEIATLKAALTAISLDAEGPKLGGSCDPARVPAQVAAALTRRREQCDALVAKLAAADRGECLRCPDLKYALDTWFDCVQDIIHMDSVAPDAQVFVDLAETRIALADARREGLAACERHRAERDAAHALLAARLKCDTRDVDGLLELLAALDSGPAEEMRPGLTAGQLAASIRVLFSAGMEQTERLVELTAQFAAVRAAVAEAREITRHDHPSSLDDVLARAEALAVPLNGSRRVARMQTALDAALRLIARTQTSALVRCEHSSEALVDCHALATTSYEWDAFPHGVGQEYRCDAHPVAHPAERAELPYAADVRALAEHA